MRSWKNVILSCYIGNVLEMYDFILFAYFSKTISKLFFPTQDPNSALMLTFVVFATGNLMRPLGSIYFGYIGDKHGRKAALIYSMTLMALSTALMGLLPTYASIGSLAPILLIACRLVQGFSIAGEQVSAGIYLMETAPVTRTGFAGSLIFSGIYLGLVLGSATALLSTFLISPENLALWGWRIPFVCSLVLAAIALRMRLKLFDSEPFAKAKLEQKLFANPVIIFFQKYWRQLILTFFCCALEATSAYLFVIYIPSTLQILSGFTVMMSIALSLGLFLFTCISILAAGLLTDLLGSTKVMTISCILAILMAYPIFFLLSYHTIASTIYAMIIFSIIVATNTASILPLIAEHYPVPVRVIGTSLSINLCITIFGGAGPVLGVYLTKISGSANTISIYLIASALITLVSLYIMKTKTKYSIH